MIPIGPTFEDPEPNFSPFVISASPEQGARVGPSEDIVVTLGDPNLGDQLTVRWIFNFPPFADESRFTVEQTIPSNAGGESQIRAVTARVTPTCFRDLPPGLDEHRVSMVVSDRGFLPEPAPFDSAPRDAHVMRASWTIVKTCYPP